MCKREFTIPFRVKGKPFRKCEECHKRKINVALYTVHDTGLNSHIKAFICVKCLEEAKQRCKEKTAEIESLINYLIKNHPYPEDVFINKGKEARVGYNACISLIKEFFEME